ncbi:hypothetical protein OEA41_006330 [Lepraria neglecta]|uniref:Uncharacterized protein n=1 Tax=Lepraria neglecta TaxID=209136 RepID=A0AAD9ZB02_9LECA|nr:hypothetical protein OEA41_006330 [Lepraria neglecta]
MRAIGRLEKVYKEGPDKLVEPAESSYHPLSPDTRANTDPDPPDNHRDAQPDKAAEPAKTETSPWLPCHYFDYVAGTSTGGTNNWAAKSSNTPATFTSDHLSSYSGTNTLPGIYAMP